MRKDVHTKNQVRDARWNRGFSIGRRLGAGLILGHSDAPAVRPMLRSGRAVGGIRHPAEIASEDSFPATDAPVCLWQRLYILRPL